MESTIEWLVSFNEIAPLWKNQPLFLVVQLSYLIGILATLIHATANRGSWPGLWLIIFFNGIFLETISFFTPQINNFWHSQTPIMLLGKRLPLYLTFLYPCSFYTAAVGASLMNLPRKIEPLAAGILAVLMNAPFEIIGSKFLFWTWHDTDPLFLERSYGVPWVTYLLHVTFAAVVRTLYPSEEWKPSVKQSRPNSKKVCGRCRNKKGIALGLIFGSPIILGLMTVVYFVPHNTFNLHSEIIVTIFLSFFASIIWTTDVVSNKKIPPRGTKGTTLLVLFLTIHYAINLVGAVFSDPREQISDGLHQPIGNCNVSEPMQTILGTTLYRDKFLCLDRFNDEIVDFHCVPNFTVPKGKVISWYKICGTPHRNKNEFISIIFAISAVAFIVFRNIFCVRLKKYKTFKNE